MKPKAFVYTEVQLSLPFRQSPWKEINSRLLQQPGLLNKTWLSGVNNNSLGGIYAFDSIENAQHFVTSYFPGEAKGFGVALTSRIFDAALAQEASEGIDSVHFGAKLPAKPGAFVYTELQINTPFDHYPWRDRNAVLKNQPGLLCKTWLSGLHTNTVGGLDAFDTLENATRFILEDFPRAVAKLKTAFYTRIFDASVVEEASREMRSPYFRE